MFLGRLRRGLGASASASDTLSSGNTSHRSSGPAPPHPLFSPPDPVVPGQRISRIHSPPPPPPSSSCHSSGPGPNERYPPLAYDAGSDLSDWLEKLSVAGDSNGSDDENYHGNGIGYDDDFFEDDIEPGFPESANPYGPSPPPAPASRVSHSLPVANALVYNGFGPDFPGEGALVRVRRQQDSPTPSSPPHSPDLLPRHAPRLQLGRRRRLFAETSAGGIAGLARRTQGGVY